jgi:putative membrane protein
MKAKTTFYAFLAGTGVLTLLFTEKAALAYRGQSCWWGPGTGFMGGWGMGWFGPLFTLLFWGLLIAGGIYLVRWSTQLFSGRSPNTSDSSDALDIIRTRYASGEIDREEFKRMKEALGGTSG